MCSNSGHCCYIVLPRQHRCWQLLSSRWSWSGPILLICTVSKKESSWRSCFQSGGPLFSWNDTCTVWRTASSAVWSILVCSSRLLGNCGWIAVWCVPGDTRHAWNGRGDHQMPVLCWTIRFYLTTLWIAVSLPCSLLKLIGPLWVLRLRKIYRLIYYDLSN